MLLSLFWTLAGLVAGGGGLGLAALYVPTVGALLKSALDFLRSPLGTAIGILAGVVILYGAGYIAGDIHGAGEVRGAWKADTAKRIAAETNRETWLAAEMKRFASAGVTVDLTYSRSIDQKVQDYVAKTPAAVCRRATRDDVERLLSIK